MMRFFYLAIFSLLAISAKSQDSRATAVSINLEEKKQISLLNQQYYYLKSAPPANGTIEFIVEGKKTSGSQGGFALYVYDETGRSLGSKDVAQNATVGSNFKDTIKIYSRAPETLFFLLFNANRHGFDVTASYLLTDRVTQDPEPNNSMGTATVFNSSQTVKGNIGYEADGALDNYDYYKTLLPANGTVQIFVEGKHTGGSNGSFGFYAYDKTGRTIFSKSSVGTTVSRNQMVSDTLNIYSQNADTIYFLIFQPGSRSFEYSLNYKMLSQSPNDQEPNNTRQQANIIGAGEKISGQIGYVNNGVTDHDDYYKTMLPGDGTIKLFFDAEHTGGSNGSFGFYAYDQTGRTVFSQALVGEATGMGGKITDTIEIVSRAADTIFFLIHNPGGRSINYKFGYEMIDQSVNDQEPNHNANTAIYLPAGQEAVGHLGYEKDGAVDTDDYYKIMLPEDGTVQVIVEALHTGGSAGSLGFYAYDYTGRGIFSKTSIGQPVNRGGTLRDTLLIYSRTADTILLRLFQPANRSLSYKISYQMLHTSENDQEPNNSQASATYFAEKQTMVGHLGYVKDGAIDNSDYYETALPVDGSVKVIIEATNTAPGTGTLGFYAYDATGRTIFSKAEAGRPMSFGGIIRDTIIIDSRAADTVLFRLFVSNGLSFSYKLRYEMIHTSENDSEPNNSVNQATPLAAAELVRGHLAYVKDGAIDQYDYYKAGLPANGTVRVMVTTKHTGGVAGNPGLYLYDRTGRSLLSINKLGANLTYLQSRTDTAYLESRADDSLYIVLFATGSQSFQYSLSFDVIDTSANDTAPNESFATATVINDRETVRGHIGYIDDGVQDSYDYYKTLLPVDGTVTVYLEAEHTGGSQGSLDFYAYDKGRSSIFRKISLGSGTFTKGSIIRDTIVIDSRAADTIFFLIYNSAGRSFSYNFYYEMPQALDSDPEPNNSFAEAVRVSHTDTLQGLIGYVQSGRSDASDYYKADIPRGSTVKIYLEGEHTGGTAGTFSFYAYDNGRRTIFSRAAIGQGPVNRGEIVRDTISLNCYNADSIYLLIFQPSSRSFSYTMRMEMEDNQPRAEFKYNKAGSLHEFTNRSSNAMSYIWNIGDTVINDRIAPPLLSLPAGNHQVRLIAQNSECNFRDTSSMRLVVNGLDRYTPGRSGPGNIQFTAYGGGFHEGMQLTLRNGGAIFRDSLTEVSAHGNVFAALVDMHDAPLGVYDIEIKTKDTLYRIPGGYQVDGLVDRLKTEIVGRDIIRVNTAAPYSVRVINEGNTMAGLTEVHVLFPMYMNVKFLDTMVDIVRTKYPDIDLDTVAFPRIVTKAKNGYPIDGKLFSFYIAGIPPGGYRDLNFSVSSGAGAQSIHTWVVGPGSGSKYKGWFDPCNEAKMKMVLDALLDAANVIPVADCAISAVRFAGSSLYARIASMLGYGDPPPASVAKSLAGVTKNCAGELLTAAGFAPGVAVEIADVLADLGIMASNAHLNAAMVKDACNDQPEEEDEKPVEVLQSFDPNAKSGPSGFGRNHYINGFDKIMNYTIYFENIDTATLPAQMVQIVDTLDKSVFDLSSFRTFNFTVSGKKYQLPMGALDYSMDLPFNDDLGIRFSINLDTASGVMTAVMKTLDNNTGALTDDPLAGFLPPNKNAPEGEGSISFAINLKEGLSDGTVIRNKASIIFDTNEPIITEEWVNTIDRNVPSSKVVEVSQNSDTTCIISIAGSDPASGVRKYRLYAAENNGDFKYVGDMQEDTATFTGVLGNTYDFYAVAVDNVSNREVKNAGSEARVTLKSSSTEPVASTSLLAYPIPTTGQLTIEFPTGEAQQINISLFSSTGERAMELYNGNASGNFRISKQISQLSGGIYFVRVKGSKGLNLYKKIILIK